MLQIYGQMEKWENGQICKWANGQNAPALLSAGSKKLYSFEAQVLFWPCLFGTFAVCKMWNKTYKYAGLS